MGEKSNIIKTTKDFNEKLTDFNKLTIRGIMTKPEYSSISLIDLENRKELRVIFIGLLAECNLGLDFSGLERLELRYGTTFVHTILVPINKEQLSNEYAEILIWNSKEPIAPSISTGS